MSNAGVTGTDVYSTLVETSSPGDVPLDREEAKEHARVDFTTDDSFFDTLIDAATEHTEDVTNRTLIERDYKLIMDHFPRGDRFEIPKPPLKSITDIFYYDTDDTQYTWDSSEYFVDSESDPGRVVLRDGESFPSETLRSTNAVEIEFTAGYGSGPANVPDGIKQAMKFLVTHWYENREHIALNKITREIPETYSSLIDKYRIRRVF